jgi:hypothetical protein
MHWSQPVASYALGDPCIVDEESGTYDLE